MKLLLYVDVLRVFMLLKFLTRANAVKFAT